MVVLTIRSGARTVRDFPMPSLFRFLLIVAVIGGLAYGSMYALAAWFVPKPRDITVSIPPEKFLRR
jgi:hypothetical protein